MNPATLETLKALAGIANAERIRTDNKDLANDMVNTLLKMIQRDVNLASAASQGIITGQA